MASSYIVGETRFQSCVVAAPAFNVALSAVTRLWAARLTKYDRYDPAL